MANDKSFDKSYQIFSTGIKNQEAIFCCRVILLFILYFSNKKDKFTQSIYLHSIYGNTSFNNELGNEAKTSSD
jgi:hypothetical protein